MTHLGTVLISGGIFGLISGAMGYAAGLKDGDARAVRRIQRRQRALHLVSNLEKSAAPDRERAR